MKIQNKTISILLLILILICAPAVNAQTATPRPTSSQSVSPTVSETINEKLNSQINQLKDKIASRVTELNLVEKKGVTGVVSESSSTKITLRDIKGGTELIDVDEITKFSSNSAKGTFGLSDLTKGTKINVLGLYNKQSKRILARFITTAVNPVFLSGGISEIDPKNFTVTLMASDKKTTKIDIGATTRTMSYDGETELTRIGFSKLTLGDRISIIGFPDKTDPALIVAQRVVVFPGLPNDPKISITEPTATTAPTAVLRRVTQVPTATRISPTVAR